MKGMEWLSSAAAIGLFAAGLAAQTRPNFPGQWTREPAPTATAQAGAGQVETARGVRLGNMGSGWGPRMTITQDASRLKVECAYFAPKDMQPPLIFVYALNGTETENSVMMGRGRQVQVSKAEWVRNTLVITTRHTFNHPETGQTITSEVKQKLSIESPDLLIVEVERSGVLGGPPSTTRTTYRKH